MENKNKIRVSGYQNFYQALLCINRETKKTWILKYDAYIQQPFEDNIYFQAEPYIVSYFDDPISLQELKNIYTLMHENPILFEEKYAIYILYGGASAYTDGELDENMKERSHQYKSHYQRPNIKRLSWKEDVLRRIRSSKNEN